LPLVKCLGDTAALEEGTAQVITHPSLMYMSRPYKLTHSTRPVGPISLQLLQCRYITGDIKNRLSYSFAHYNCCRCSR
jgi:hypothetical protein